MGNAERQALCTPVGSWGRVRHAGYLTTAAGSPASRRGTPTTSPRTTKLYDRRRDEISLDEVERILMKAGCSQKNGLIRGPLYHRGGLPHTWTSPNSTLTAIFEHLQPGRVPNSGSEQDCDRARS